MVTSSVVPDAPEPVDLGVSDVEMIEKRTRSLRSMDHRLGGGSCLDGALTLVHRMRRLPGKPIGDGRERLHVAVADLHNLVGWVSFDVGLALQAHRYFSQALALAGRGGDDRLIADIFYRLGRMQLHQDNPVEALDYFQAGMHATDAAGHELAASILSMNQAWAHAVMGAEDQACDLIDRSRAQFATAPESDRPSWSSFFTRTDMLAMTGTVHSELAHRVDPEHARIAIPMLTEAVDDYGDDMARSRTFSLILLAMSHLVDGNVDHGVDVGFRALAAAENLTSVRVRDRMRPLKADAERHDTHSGARELAARIAAFTTPQGHKP